MSVRILVTGSSLFYSARLIHDLGKRGVTITAADSLLFSAGKSSRFVSRRLRVPAVKTDPAGFMQAIEKELKQNSYDLLLPTFEEDDPAGEYQDDLKHLTRLFLPRFEDIYRLHHKPRYTSSVLPIDCRPHQHCDQRFCRYRRGRSKAGISCRIEAAGQQHRGGQILLQ